MVGADIGNHRNIRPALHTVQLERAELQHNNILIFHLRGFTQKRLADVAPEMHRVTCRLQQLGNDGGRGSLPVAPRHGKDAAGTNLKEDLHL